ncbi:hypothetical protein WMC41_09890 [Shinella yambaruensis]|uniref:hypothetical protein n=1 Tax=Shinella yambaruensis TaxID=415996 RepID=UPI003D7BEF3F
MISGDLADFLNYIGTDGPKFLVGGIFGFIVSRFTLSKAEKIASDQKKYENADKHAARRIEKYNEFHHALQAYCEKSDGFNLDDFFSISKAGDNYFNELRLIADAIMQDRIPANMRDNTFVPDIMSALSKNIPLYYDTLHKIAKKVKAPYTGKFEAKNYASMIHVIEKYGKSQELAPIGS